MTNYQQRLFDLLRASPELLPLATIRERIALDRRCLASALDRLRRLHVLITVYEQGSWRYGIKPSAERPTDRRSKPCGPSSRLPAAGVSYDDANVGEWTTTISSKS